VDQKQIVSSLILKAKKYRSFALSIGDIETARRIVALTHELIQRARALARPDEAQIRKRAREIWEENGRPAGRDEEFWLQAEREFREAEKLTKEIGDDAG
jgi:DUF2934 family protein